MPALQHDDFRQFPDGLFHRRPQGDSLPWFERLSFAGRIHTMETAVPAVDQPARQALRFAQIERVRPCRTASQYKNCAEVHETFFLAESKLFVDGDFRRASRDPHRYENRDRDVTVGVVNISTSVRESASDDVVDDPGCVARQSRRRRASRSPGGCARQIQVAE